MCRRMGGVHPLLVLAVWVLGFDWPTPGLATAAPSNGHQHTPLELPHSATSGSSATRHVLQDKKRDPRPHNASLLVGISAFDPLERLWSPGWWPLERELQNLNDACLLGLQVVCIIHTVNPLMGGFLAGLVAAPNCPGLFVHYELRPKSVRFSLARLHRSVFAALVDHFDWFLYMEDDVDLPGHTVPPSLPPSPATVGRYLGGWVGGYLGG